MPHMLPLLCISLVRFLPKRYGNSSNMFNYPAGREPQSKIEGRKEEKEGKKEERRLKIACTAYKFFFLSSLAPFFFHLFCYDMHNRRLMPTTVRNVPPIILFRAKTGSVRQIASVARREFKASSSS
jgi:hypothetical protein